MITTTMSYQWGLQHGLGQVAALSINLPTNGKGSNLSKEVWFHFTDFYGKLQIRNGGWQDFVPGIEIKGIRFNSVTKQNCEGYDNYNFIVDWEYVE
jgi:hypothetical protein